MSKNNPLECKMCKVVYKTNTKIMKHKISKTHLNNLKNIVIEPFEILENDTHNSNDVDPFLNKNDIDKLKNMNIGDGFDITYKNNDVVKCEYEFEAENNTNIQVEPIATDEHIQSPPVITDKQSKILDFLIKNQTHQQVANKFFQVLQKLGLEDLKGFSTHIISNDDIQILIKQKIMKVITIYKETLIKKKESGQTHFNNFLIEEIISLLIV
jgi:hypothetical protein